MRMKVKLDNLIKKLNKFIKFMQYTYILFFFELKERESTLVTNFVFDCIGN